MNNGSKMKSKWELVREAASLAWGFFGRVIALGAFLTSIWFVFKGEEMAAILFSVLSYGITIELKLDDIERLLKEKGIK
jgi:hypothetical protein